MNQNYKNGINYLVSGKTFNEIAQAVNYTKEQMRQSDGSRKIAPFENGEIRVKYKDDPNLPVFSAVALTNLEIVPENNDFVYEPQAFQGKLPTAANANMPFAVIVDDVEKNEYVRAVLIGVVPAKVRINDSSAEYAIPTPGGNGALETSSTGTARIIWKAGNTGEQWCILELGCGGSGTAYNSYFKIINASTTDAEGNVSNKIKIVDGATYNSETGLSGDSVCKVNNMVFNVPTFLADITESTIFVLQFTAETDETPATVEIIAVDCLPPDTAQNAYYQIGRVYLTNGSIKIQQDHTAGIAQIYWYLLCSEDEN